uniref:ATP-binding protein n=1 Tax=Candidatus Entotheonella palauensis TaxID=93172 RepID=UPI001178A5E4
AAMHRQNPRIFSWITVAAARRGQRQVWMVVGEAGIGKTSLVDTFVEQLAERASVVIGRGQCIDHYGVSEPYLPLLEAFGNLAQTAHGQHMVEILRQHAPSWLLQLPALLTPGQSERLRQEAIGASQERMLRELAEAVEALTSSHPLIIVLEDLHWSDVSTLNWLAYIARRRTPSHLMIVGTYRPVDAALRDHPVRTVIQELRLHGLCEELVLDYLSAAGVTTYLTQRFGPQIASSGLAHMLHQRTQGNPLFLMAMIEALISQGVMADTSAGWRVQDTLETAATIVPSSLRQLVEYHLLALDLADQSLLEAASVVGATFTAAAVAAGLSQSEDAVEVRCQALARPGQFMREFSLETWPDGTMTSLYQFIHEIYRDVVYTRISAGRQRRLHRRLAARLEAAYADHLSDIAAQLAFHHNRGQNYGQAVRFHDLAARHALGRSGYQEAIVQAREGLDLLPHLAEPTESRRCEFDLHMSLGPALMAIKGYGDLEVEQSYSRARQLCRDLGEESRMFPVLWGLWRFYNSQGDFQTARQVGGQLLALAQDQDDPDHRLAAHQALGFTLFYLGELMSARMHLEAGIALIDPKTQLALAHRYGSAPGVTCLALLAQVLWALGYADQARQRCREACALADDLAHPHSRVSAHFVTARVYLYCRDMPSVREHTEVLMPVATEHAFAQRVAAGQFLQGWLLAVQDQVEVGIEHMRLGLAGILDTGAVIYQPLCLLVLADVYGKANQTEAGLRALSEAIATIGEDGQSYLAAELYRLQGELLLQHIPVERVQPESGFQQALDTARRQQAKGWELRAAMSLARLWQRQGMQRAAHALLEPVYRWFTEGFDTADMQEARGLLAALSHASHALHQPGDRKADRTRQDNGCT